MLHPTVQTLKIHNEMELMNFTLSKLSKEFNNLQSDKQELINMNLVQ